MYWPTDTPTLADPNTPFYGPAIVRELEIYGPGQVVEGLPIPIPDPTPDPTPTPTPRRPLTRRRPRPHADAG